MKKMKTNKKKKGVKKKNKRDNLYGTIEEDIQTKEVSIYKMIIIIIILLLLLLIDTRKYYKNKIKKWLTVITKEKL